MSLFGTGTVGNNVEKETDTQKRTVDTNEYTGEIKMAFAGQSASGARFVELQINLDSGRPYTERIYVSNKEGKNTYVKDDKEAYLPGFLVLNNLAIFATGKGLHDLAADVETRTIKLYDYDVKREVATDVPAIVPLIGKRVLLAIQEEEQEKNTKGADGVYRPSGEVRIANVITKVYDPETRKSAVETRDDLDATHLDAWVARNKGVIKKANLKGGASANQKVATKPSGLF